MKKIVVIMEGMSGVTYHRLAMPFAYIKEKVDFTIDYAITKPQIAELKDTIHKYDIVVMSRHLSDMSLLDLIKKHKVKLIVDIDDYWNIPKYNPAYQFYKDYGKKAVLRCLSEADMVWTTTHQLAYKIEEINKNVKILPNYIDTNESQWKSKADHPLTIGYVAGATHIEDVKLLRGQIEKVCKEFNARFLLCGYAPLDPISMEMEYIITGSKRSRPEWFWISETTNVLNYGRFYAHMDVALAPLMYSNFNQYKSELKIIEAAAYNLPIVCSKVQPYTNHTHNDGVVFVDNDNNWVDAIAYAIDNRERLGVENADYCNYHHNIDTINYQRINLLRNL